MVTKRRDLALAAAGALCALSVSLPRAVAQNSRRTLSLSRPGVGLGQLGVGPSTTNTFQSFSYGLGSLQDSSSGYGGGVLGSSIRRRGTPSASAMTVPRSSTAMIGGVAPLGARVGAAATNNPIAPRARAGARMGVVPGSFYTTGAFTNSIGPTVYEDRSAVTAAGAYLAAVEAASESRLEKRDEPITALVPTEPGPYRDYMLRGDRAFRANNYHVAYTDFRIAHDIGRVDPESLIYLTHTQFALSRYSYAKAAYFLEKAIRLMPELPLADLRPRGFYASPAKFAEHLLSLEDHVRRSPYDAEAELMMAYFRWFGKGRDVDATRKALSYGLRGAMNRRDIRLVEAIEAFWDGMVAAGKVQGKLEPAEDPLAAATTKPAPAPESPAAPEAEPAPADANTARP
jgi:exonuclease VII small subunit